MINQSTFLIISKDYIFLKCIYNLKSRLTNLVSTMSQEKSNGKIENLIC